MLSVYVMMHAHTRAILLLSAYIPAVKRMLPVASCYKCMRLTTSVYAVGQFRIFAENTDPETIIGR